jgi:HPt (histidine-containing phosphotransfer) domain-containing protein
MQIGSAQESALLIDLEALAARCLGNAQLVERVLAKFTVQLETDLVRLEKALEAGDTQAFRAVAHRLKGMSANVEAWPLHACAKEAEELALRDEVDELAAQLQRFHEMRRQLSTVLTRPNKTQVPTCDPSR